VISPDLEADLERHDAVLAKLGLRVWVGGEPTFTNRFSTDPEWRGEALGGDKEEWGERVLARMAARAEGAAVLRTTGRLYPGESAPRWSKGIYARRDGAPAWTGPPDPCRGGGACTPDLLARLRDVLAQRVVGRADDLRVWRKSEVRKRRPGDADASHDKRALIVGVHAATGAALIELPVFAAVPGFLEALTMIAEAATAAGVSGLVLTGAPPPADASVWWSTVTPDPGVLEINLAPAQSALELARDLDAVYADTASAGVAAYCLHFNGDIADSGGGGHLTLGGPSPEESPFALHPHLVPRLIAYFVRHPSLSYLFADHAGSSSQAPRVDETSRESLGELALALHLLTQAPGRSLETTWRSLAPFLADRFGNTHRCEINVEKLCNPYLPGRGKLGLVELRALRMPESPSRWAALAALFRSIVARLVIAESSIALETWSASDLHDKLALPFFQRADLRAVLSDLATHGLGLGDAIVAELVSDPHRVVTELSLRGCSVVIRRATEFWPLVGDLSAQNGTSRLIDPSCRRVEVLLRPSDGATEWSLAVEGFRVPWVHAEDERGEALVLGVRSREFVPAIALHPLLAARSTIEIAISHPRHGAHRLTVHAWQPDGGAYDGVPASHEVADARRRARVVVEEIAASEIDVLPEANPSALSAFSVDARWLPPRHERAAAR
jgi:uncharacterized protein (DUF2126 family)